MLKKRKKKFFFETIYHQSTESLQNLIAMDLRNKSENISTIYSLQEHLKWKQVIEDMPLIINPSTKYRSKTDSNSKARNTNTQTMANLRH